MKYKVNDKVTIRSWEAMERQEKVNRKGNIDKFDLVPDMKQYCGRQALITSVNRDDYLLDIDNGEYNWDEDTIAHNFTYGQKILVWDGDGRKYERIFVGYIDGAFRPNTIVSFETEQKFHKGKIFEYFCYQHAEPISPKPNFEVTVMLNGQPVSPNSISEETWANLKEGNQND